MSSILLLKNLNIIHESINLTDNSFRAVIVNLIRREIEKSYDG